MIHFFIPKHRPIHTSQQSGRRGSQTFVKPEHSNQTASLVEKVKGFVPETPLAGPIAVDVVIVKPYTSTDTKTKAAKARTEELVFLPDPVKPDWDNAVKPIMDVLGDEGFFENDSRIVQASVIQCRGPKPGIAIRLRAIEEENGAIEAFAGSAERMVTFAARAE